MKNTYSPKSEFTLNRRQFLSAAAASVAMSSLPTSLSFAALPTDKKFVFIHLRGGLDGLSLYPPIGDRDYHAQRAGLALPKQAQPGAPIPLTKLFGLHPMAEALFPFWTRKELAVIPAAGLPIADGSHFSAQEILESGYSRLGGDGTGWLARVVEAAGGDDASLLHVGYNTPMIAQSRSGASSLVEQALEKPLAGYGRRLTNVHNNDILLAPALQNSISHIQKNREFLPDDDQFYGKDSPPVFALENAAKITAKALRNENGHNIAVLQSSGFDTHIDQGAGSGKLARRLAAVSASIEALASEMQNEWLNTVVVVTSEFGRSVTPNKKGGTDNGYATATTAVGGAVQGGQIIGTWPSIAAHNLEQGGALRATVDMRSIFKAVLNEHLGIPMSIIETEAFPDSSNILPLQGLIRI